MFFNSIDEIREFLPISTGVEFSRLKPHLQMTEQNFIRPLLGIKLASELDQVPGVQSLSGAHSQLLSLIRSAEIHLVYWLGYDVLNAYISDGGFRRIETDKVKGLFKYQEDNLKEYFKLTGFNNLDICLEFIEENLADLPSFKDSLTWQSIRNSFIKDTRVLNSIYFINNSRLVFLRLQPYFNIIEDLQIKPVLGLDNYNTVKSGMLKEVPEERVVNILPFIRKSIAFLSVSMLMEESGADLTDKGLYFEGKTSNSVSDQIKQPAETERVSALVKRSKGLGESYLVQLKEYLLSNSSLWSNYSAPKSGLHNRDNTAKKTFWT